MTERTGRLRPTLEKGPKDIVVPVLTAMDSMSSSDRGRVIREILTPTLGTLEPGVLRGIVADAQGELERRDTITIDDSGSEVEDAEAHVQETVHEQGAPHEEPAQVTESVEVNRGEKWADIIRTQGGGFLYGKVQDYFLDGVSRPGTGSTLYELKGGLGRQRVTTEGSSAQLATLSHASQVMTDITTQRNKPLSEWNFNYLVRIPPGPYKEMPEGDYQGYMYNMWMDRSVVPDTRVQSPGDPFRFCFFLPKSEALPFEDDIMENADVMEQVFQACYPGATDRGLARVEAPGIIVFNMREADNGETHYTKVYGSDYVNELKRRTPLFFTQPVGEKPFSPVQR